MSDVELHKTCPSCEHGTVVPFAETWKREELGFPVETWAKLVSSETEINCPVCNGSGYISREKTWK